MRPHGVTNHFARFTIPNDPIESDEDFLLLIARIKAAMEEAVHSVMTCAPDRLVLGMSAETFWDGLEGSRQLAARLHALAGVPVTIGSDAIRAALGCYGVRRIAIVTPYMPVGDTQVRRFFTDCGYDVVALKGLRCNSPVNIAHVSERELRDAVLEVNAPSVEAIVQVGTNLAMARLAGIAEFWLDKPVLAINSAIYWHALRESGLQDRIHGYGSLLSEH